jgi:alkyl hydroperoxide reductase subunit F
MYDLIIIGGGPAGIAAGIYAARKKIKTLLITDTFGGQSLAAKDIQNFIGIKSISGLELAQKLEEHLRAQSDIDIIDSDLVTVVEKISNGFSAGGGSVLCWKVATKNGKTFESKTILVVSGSRRKKLNIPGEAEFEGRGVSYCSTCDAPLFKNKVVAVIGGGNVGLETVLDLMPYAKKIYLLEFLETLKGDPATLEKIKAEIITMAKTTKIIGNQFVTGLEYEDRKTGEIKKIAADAVFIAIGLSPNSDFIKELVKLNNFGEIVIDSKTQKTSCEGIWAAGDVTDILYRQNNISIGDAIKAVLNIHDYFIKQQLFH